MEDMQFGAEMADFPESYEQGEGAFGTDPLLDRPDVDEDDLDADLAGEE